MKYNMGALRHNIQGKIYILNVQGNLNPHVNFSIFIKFFLCNYLHVSVLIITADRKIFLHIKVKNCII